MELMRAAIINGSRSHPGANVLEKMDERGQPIRIALHVVKDIENRKNTARNLKIGDIVHRHLRDGE
jgi:DNA-directed RNA polymerase III subunit RPC1